PAVGGGAEEEEEEEEERGSLTTSHVTPSYQSGQRQWNLPNASAWHVAPFRQGCRWHGSGCSQFTPERQQKVPLRSAALSAGPELESRCREAATGAGRCCGTLVGVFRSTRLDSTPPGAGRARLCLSPGLPSAHSLRRDSSLAPMIGRLIARTNSTHQVQKLPFPFANPPFEPARSPLCRAGLEPTPHDDPNNRR
ncbi:unnamed protein product, partial [Protopolystoma xenopodis]